MKKKLLAAILMGTMVFGMTACGGSNEESTNNQETQTEADANAGTEDEKKFVSLDQVS